MKIAVTFTPEERPKAEAAVRAILSLLPMKSKETPERDGYCHCYLETFMRRVARPAVVIPENMGNDMPESC